ncbi:hypothetical protein [Mycobacterium intracellulare]|uniref:hypothetical protein n=1 Tax=Mycobacterium intracellulare TaxID=1767 RepID=UPI001EEDE271|nr:hypothetical protein [Mycobacterium intracellulare]MEE3755276.1 hypothetical protein [Mycobacterium intracellulare]
MWANWVLAPLNLIDRNGARVQHYRLILDGGWGPGEFFAWITSDIVYLLVIVPAAYSAQIVDFVINPGSWLKPIQKAWTSVTSTLFEFISPTVLLAAVLLGTVVMVTIRARNADEALKAVVQRTVASVGMYVLILALLYNPAGTLLNFLTIWVRLLGGFDNDAAGVEAVTLQPGASATAADGAHRVGDVVAAGTDNSVLTNFLRPLTWMLNYGSQLSPDCAKQWARLIELGEPMTCLNSDQVQASQNVGVAFVMTVLALVPVYIYVRFAFVVFITFATHLVLALVRFATAGAAAAMAVTQDRPFDEFLRFMVSALANLTVASGILTVARLGPKAAVGIAEALSDSTLVQFAALIAAYYMLSMGVWALEKQFGPIRDWMLKAAAGATPTEGDHSRWWSLVFPGGLNPQANAVDRMISRARQQGSQWAQQTREQVKKMANDKLLAGGVMHGGAAAANLAAATATPGLVADTAQSASLAAVVNTVDHQPNDTLAPPVAAAVQTILSRLAAWRQPRATLPGTAQASPPQALAAVLDEQQQFLDNNHRTIGPADVARMPTVAAPDGTPIGQPQTPPRIDTAGTNGHHHWRERLRDEAKALTAAAAEPELLRPITLDGESGEPVSTLTDPRGNALDLPGTHATAASYLARVSYMEIVMRAMGWQGKLDSRALLPSGTTLFTSGLDEAGNWVTEFHN